MNAFDEYTSHSYTSFATCRNDFWQFDCRISIRMRNKLISMNSGMKSTSSTGLHFCPISFDVFHIFSHWHVQLLHFSLFKLHERESIFGNGAFYQTAVVTCCLWILFGSLETIPNYFFPCYKKGSRKRKNLSMSEVGKIVHSLFIERSMPKIPQKCFIFSMLSQFTFSFVNNIDLCNSFFILDALIGIDMRWLREAWRTSLPCRESFLFSLSCQNTNINCGGAIFYFFCLGICCDKDPCQRTRDRNEKFTIFSLCWQVLLFFIHHFLDECEFILHRRNNFQLCYSFEKVATDLQVGTDNEHGRQCITMNVPFCFRMQNLRNVSIFYLHWMVSYSHFSETIRLSPIWSRFYRINAFKL